MSVDTIIKQSKNEKRYNFSFFSFRIPVQSTIEHPLLQTFLFILSLFIFDFQIEIPHNPLYDEEYKCPAVMCKEKVKTFFLSFFPLGLSLNN